ncbi:MAG: hypothetical protein WKG07_00430 [Hymenobacter sp.]
MRAILLLSLILSTPLVSQAQDGAADFERGSFKLKNSSVVQEGLMRLGNKNLVVKQLFDGPNTKYPWADVSSYCLGLQKFIRASGFVIKSPSGWSYQPAEEEFVELLDSGTVSLLRYKQFHANQQGGSYEVLYLLKRADESKATAIPFSVLDGAGKKFREFLEPYVTGRPDLLALLRDKKITIYNLQTFIHASNHREPFLHYPMQELLPSSK